jgi:hypothetical protein
MNWAHQQRIHPLITSFIQCHPQTLSNFDPNLTEAITYASPAGYERLSKGIEEVLGWPEALVKAWFCGAVGQSAGTQLYAYVGQKHKVDGILKNLQNPDSSELPVERDLLYLLCALLINRAAYAATEEKTKDATQQLLEAVAVLATRILGKSREHGVYLIKSLRLNPDTTVFFAQSKAHQILVDSIIADRHLYEAIFSEGLGRTDP